MTTQTVTTIWKAPGVAAGSSQRNRGGVFGPDGLIYVSLIDYNGLGALDPKTGAWPRFVGDFRNECMVSDLTDVLGFDKIRSLDAEAARWLAEQKQSMDPKGDGGRALE